MSKNIQAVGGGADEKSALPTLMCLPAAGDSQQGSATNNNSDSAQNMAMLFRRQMAMQQARGAGEFGNQNVGGSALANYAGITADSFAQSFVDRFAGKMGADSGIGMTTSTLGGQNTMMSSSWPQDGGGSISDSEYRKRMMAMMEQQVGWRICAYCQNGAFMTMLDLQAHESGCPFRMMPSSYGQNMMNPIKQQQQQLDMMNPMQLQRQQKQEKDINNSFLGCLPVGTSIPSADDTGKVDSLGAGESRANSGSGSRKEEPDLPVYADVDAASSKADEKQQKKQKKDPPKKEDDPEIIENSKGPFKTLDEPILLALEGDDYWLTPLHCFVRKHCVEVFTATGDDAVKTPTKGKRKNVVEGQIGIRCPHCNKKAQNQSANDDKGKQDPPLKGSVYYPNSISNIYNATMNLLQRHLFFCPNIPDEILKKYSILKKDDARSGTSKKYWIESAKSMGFVDTLSGIKLSAKPPPPAPTVEARKRTRNLLSDAELEEVDNVDDNVANHAGEDESPLVFPEDDKFTKFAFLLVSQMRQCQFTEADRLGKRKSLPNGFAGIACRHCFGGFGSGRFFPSSIKTLSDTSKTLDVIFHHLERCRDVPTTVVIELTKAKETHEAERAGLKFGSQKGKC